MAREAEVLSPRARAMRGLLTCYGLSIYLFLFAPIVLLVLFSFNANTYGSFPITGWTTKWYSQVFGDYEIQDALRTTLKVGFEVTAVSVLLGTAAAFPLVRGGLPFPAGFRVAMTLPIMIPGILIGICLLVLFTQVVKVPLSPSTAVIGQSLYTTPFVLLLVAARLQGFDRRSRREHVQPPPPRHPAADLPGDPGRCALRLHALVRRVRDHLLHHRRLQHPADLHLHADQVWDHPGGERARLARSRHLDPTHQPGVRRARGVSADATHNEFAPTAPAARGRSRPDRQGRLLSRCQDDRFTPIRRREERLESACLRDRVLPAEQRIGFSEDGGAQVLELQPVGIARVKADPLGRHR